MSGSGGGVAVVLISEAFEVVGSERKGEMSMELVIDLECSRIALSVLVTGELELAGAERFCACESGTAAFLSASLIGSSRSNREIVL